MSQCYTTVGLSVATADKKTTAALSQFCRLLVSAYSPTPPRFHSRPFNSNAKTTLNNNKSTALWRTSLYREVQQFCIGFCSLIDGSQGENDTTIRTRRSEGIKSVVGRYARYEEVTLSTFIISLCHSDAKQRDSHQRPVTTHSTWLGEPMLCR